MPTKRSTCLRPPHAIIVVLPLWTKSLSLDGGRCALAPISHSCRCGTLILLRWLAMAIYSRRLDTKFDGLAQTRGN
jgi:hypothetical protein